MSIATKMAKEAKDAVAMAKKYNIAFDYAANNAQEVADFIVAVEMMCRIALDLADDADVHDDVRNLVGGPMIGAYYGELFVRHAGAEWTEAEGEDGLEPAVQRGKVIVLPHDIVRRRISDGKHVDVVRIFKSECKQMAKQK